MLLGVEVAMAVGMWHSAYCTVHPAAVPVPGGTALLVLLLLAVWLAHTASSISRYSKSSRALWAAVCCCYCCCHGCCWALAVGVEACSRRQPSRTMRGPGHELTCQRSTCAEAHALQCAARAACIAAVLCAGPVYVCPQAEMAGPHTWDACTHPHRQQRGSMRFVYQVCSVQMHQQGDGSTAIMHGDNRCYKGLRW